MAPTDPTTWSFFTWWLWALGLYYLVGFFIHWFRFRRLEREVFQRRRGSVEAWNRGISGWPASGYAKMLGRRALEPDGRDHGSPKADRARGNRKLEPDWRGRPKKKDLK